MRISDWSSDVCSSDLTGELRVGASNTIGNYLVGDLLGPFVELHPAVSLHVSVENTDTIAAGLLAHRIDVGCVEGPVNHPQLEVLPWRADALVICAAPLHRSEEHTSELQSLMRTSYAVFCLHKKNQYTR